MARNTQWTLACVMIALFLTAGTAPASHVTEPVDDLIESRCDTHSCGQILIDSTNDPDNHLDTSPSTGVASGLLFWGSQAVCLAEEIIDGCITSVLAGDGLAGGATSGGATLSLASMAESTVKGRPVTSGAGDPVDLTAPQLVDIVKTADGTGSGLDADSVDGVSAAAFSQTKAVFGGARSLSSADGTLTSLPNGQNTGCCVGMPLAVGGTLRNLFTTTISDGSGSFAVTIRVNGVDTALSVTQTATSGTTASDTSNSVSVSAGDKVSVRVSNSGSQAEVAWSFELGV